MPLALIITLAVVTVLIVLAVLGVILDRTAED